jgi:hypothetical protein
MSTPASADQARSNAGLSVASLAATSDIYVHAELINKEINTHIEAAKLLEKELRSLKHAYTTGNAVSRAGSAKSPHKVEPSRGTSRASSRGILASS